MGGTGAISQGGRNKKKNHGYEKPQFAAPTVIAATRGQGERNKRPGHRETTAVRAQCIPTLATVPRNAARSPSSRNASVNDASSRPRTAPHPVVGLVRRGSTTTRVAAGERELGYQSPEGDLKGVFTGDSNSGDDSDRRKKLYVMYGGSWELTSRRNVKSLRREVLWATPGVPKAALHQRWRRTTMFFGAPDCPDNMAGAGILPLITAPIIANMQLHHVLIDGGAGLNIISHAAFKQLQIPGSRLGPSRPFSGVGPQPVYPLRGITLPVTFGTEENFRTENVVFDVAEVNLPFNAIIGKLALYRFMAIAHYGYLVLKMSSLTGVLTVQGDHAATLAVVEKLHALAAETARPDDGGRNPPTSGTKAPPRSQRYNHPSHCGFHPDHSHCG
jgi:hypothetical protein